jgi:hypothetical protein
MPAADNARGLFAVLCIDEPTPKARSGPLQDFVYPLDNDGVRLRCLVGTFAVLGESLALDESRPVDYQQMIKFMPAADAARGFFVG